MAGEDEWVMLAKKVSSSNSDLPTRPLNARPALPFETISSARTHLMLVRAPSATPRGLAWAERKGAQGIEPSRLESMLRLERLNLG
jgi:hypothetical protein